MCVCVCVCEGDSIMQMSMPQFKAWNYARTTLLGHNGHTVTTAMMTSNSGSSENTHTCNHSINHYAKLCITQHISITIDTTSSESNAEALKDGRLSLLDQ